nr:hypothetical protein [uncultured Pseudomonas sp.]
MKIKFAKSFFKLSLLFCSTLAMSGCYNLATSKATPGLRPSGGADTSYVVGVIGVSQESQFRPNEQRLHLRMKGAKDWALIRMKQEPTGSTPFDIEEGGRGVGSLFALALKPGDYEIYYMRLQSGGSQMWSKREFSVPFSIEAGKAFYIGDFRSSCLSRSLARGQCHFLYDSRIERDKPLLMKKFPYLPAIQQLQLQDFSDAFPFIVESNTALRP